MSNLTSGSPSIGDTGSGNATYISCLVIMDVMIIFVKVDWCVVAAVTVRFIFCRCYWVICVWMIGALRRWYLFLLFFISCVFLVSL